jgi:hypothetical protein
MNEIISEPMGFANQTVMRANIPPPKTMNRRTTSTGSETGNFQSFLGF